MMLPTDAKKRKDIPITRGLLDYFPDACAAVAELSRIGNEQHNPGSEMHWDRSKSTDHADCVVRHLLERGTLDSDGIRHSTKTAWRALALLQTEIEEERTGSLESVPDVQPGKAYDQAHPDPRQDYHSRWLMQGPDGTEWETSNFYSFDELGLFFASSTPMLRLPPDDATTAC